MTADRHAAVPAAPVARPERNGQPVRLKQLLAPKCHEYRPAGLAVAVGAVGHLAGVGLLASAAWLITTASLRPPVLTLLVAIAAVQCFSLLRGIARYGERLASHDLALRVLARLRVWAFARIEPLVPARWPGARRGDLLSRFVADVDSLQDLYVRSVLPLVASACAATVTALTAFLINRTAGAVLALGLLIGAIGMPALAAIFGTRGGRDLTEQRGQRDGVVVEILHAIDDLMVLGALPASLARLDRAERQVARGARRSALAAGFGAIGSVGLSGVLAAAVIAASLPALDHGAISGTTVAVLGFLAFAGGEVVSGLPEAFAALAGTLASAQRVATMAAGAPAPRAPDRPTAMPTEASADVPTAVSSPAPTIALRDVTVSYEAGRRPALHHVDLRLEPGCRLALVGPSGSGKTTFGYLLLRFVDADQGQLTVDGRDVRGLDPDDVRQRIAWAPQDPHVFHATVAANLRLACPGAGSAEMAAVLEQVGLDGWLASLPRGLDTVLGERGVTVSGGERQRIGVARALLADRPVVVLDEPTAHLDPANATVVRDAVFAASPDKTVVWVTHRHAELAPFDQVVVADRGRLHLSAASDDATEHFGARTLHVPGGRQQDQRVVSR